MSRPREYKVPRIVRTIRLERELVEKVAAYQKRYAISSWNEALAEILRDLDK